MKGESHKWLQLKRHMKIREAGEWISVTWPGSQWQEIKTTPSAPFYFCSLWNYGIYVMFCRDYCCIPAACCGNLTGDLQHWRNTHLAGRMNVGFFHTKGESDGRYWVEARCSSLIPALILLPWGIFPCLLLLIQKGRGHGSSLPILCRFSGNLGQWKGHWTLP